eukprot:TRINITY_DN1397_c0_g1_i11.p1 TRINITY_DN1397_c0_g1~~TRINITY_DN1397_c0_g1_i11.p1  ORF type:complete len:258 (-),score=33.25 TRINITY_DN1397_c0_g1_i11:1231-2004(-)
MPGTRSGRVMTFRNHEFSPPLHLPLTPMRPRISTTSSQESSNFNSTITLTDTSSLSSSQFSSPMSSDLDSSRNDSFPSIIDASTSSESERPENVRIRNRRVNISQPAALVNRFQSAAPQNIAQPAAQPVSTSQSTGPRPVIILDDINDSGDESGHHTDNEVVIVEDSPQPRKKPLLARARALSSSTEKENEGPSCPICFQSFSEITRSGAEVVSTDCGHLFCKGCVDGVFQSAGTTSTKCPVCRKRILRRGIRKIFL